DGAARYRDRSARRRFSLTVLLLAAPVVLVAGCGHTTRHAAMRPPAVFKPLPVPRGVKIAVFDGDLGRPIARAHVRLGRLAAHTNRNGIAILRPRHRRLLPLRISATRYHRPPPPLTPPPPPLPPLPHLPP